MDKIIDDIVSVDLECSKRVEEAKKKKQDVQANMNAKKKEIYDSFVKEYQVKIDAHKKELEAKIIELVAMSYNKDASELSVDTKIKEELGGASLLMVGLVSEIENELDVLIQLQVAAACATIGELVDKVEEQM